MKKLFKAAALEKPDPTAGYVYRDFAQFTFSDMASSKKLAESLLEKLEGAKGAVQMTKILKLLKHCAQHGHADFQKNMQKHSDALRPFANYRGPRDPVHEDKLNQQVRDAAKEAMDAIFSERATSKAVNSLEGHGANTRDEKAPDSFRETDSALKPRSNKLQDAIDARNKKQEGVFSGLKSAVAKFGIGSEGASSHDSIMKQMDADSGSGYVGSFGSSASPQANTASSPAPVWGFKQETDSGPAISVKDTEVLSAMQQAIHTAVSKTSTPGRGEINKFIKAVSAIAPEEGDELAPRLDEKLDQKMGWQTRLNTLTLIEALIKAGTTDVIEYFSESPEDIQKNVNVVQTTVKEKAKKVLAALNVPETNATKKAPIVVPGVPSLYVDPTQDSTETPLVTEEAAPRKKKGTTSLKKRGKKLNSAVPAAAPVSIEAPVQGTGGDLFAMLSTTAAPIAPTPMATPVTPAPMASQEVPPATLGNAALDDLFSSLPASAAPAAAQAPAPTGNVGLDTLFPSSEINPAPTPHATPLTKVPQGGGFDFAAFNAAAASATSPTALPPTPVQSPVCGLAPSSAAPGAPAFAGLGVGAPAVGVQGGAAPPSDMMMQLQAQQAALQAQIEALQKAQVAVQTPMPPPGQNVPPMPQQTTAQQAAANTQFAFIGKEMEGAMK